MKKIVTTIFLLVSTMTIIAQTETSNNEKLNLQSPTGVSLFQSNSTNGIWATGTITADRWGVFEDATSAKEHLTILPGGNVGIGTTNPSQKLTVQFAGESGITAKAISNGTYGAANIVVDPATGFPGRFLFRENGQNKAWIDYLGQKINIRNSSNLSFFTVLTDNGNVGIGTTTPSEKLDVIGRIRASQSIDVTGISNPTSGVTMNLAYSASDFGLVRARDWNNNIWKPIHYQGSYHNFETGNVGIGMDNPSMKLQVAGSVAGGNNNTMSLDYNEWFNFGNASGYGFINWFSQANTSRNDFINTHATVKASSILGGNGEIRFFTSPTNNGIGQSSGLLERMTIESNGNLGIGTISPSSKLEVRGGIKASYDTNRSITFFTAGDGNAYMNMVGGTSTSRFGFQVDGSSKMSLMQNGNVGIGTTNPDAKLAVNGTVHSKEVKVDLIGWPDYVFESDYNLPTLQQVEQHINEKGHLQNIPSATEVEKEGIKLGEMNAKLLQKIEELTLYMIEQNKINQEQQSQIQELKKEIETLKTK